MADTNETIADIIAEIRALSNPISDGIIAINGRIIADRLDAALKRELTKSPENVNSVAASDTAGDCAKLREALVKCQGIALQWQADEIMGVAGSIEKPQARSASEALIDIEFVANAALDAPPRNCDKYSHDEALNIWAAENENERNGCFDEWLYHESTEQEGGSDGSK